MTTIVILNFPPKMLSDELKIQLESHQDLKWLKDEAVAFVHKENSQAHQADIISV